MKPCKFKGHNYNKGTAIYVESTTTVHNRLFYVLALWLNNLTVTFLMVSSGAPNGSFPGISVRKV